MMVMMKVMMMNDDDLLIRIRLVDVSRVYIAQLIFNLMKKKPDE